MKINFELAKQVMELTDIAYDLCTIPAYVTYDYVAGILKSLPFKTDVSEELAKIKDKFNTTAGIFKELYSRYMLLQNDKFEQQKALDNYMSFEAYYTKLLQTFEVK